MENLNELFSALSKLQGDLEPAKKDTSNPFFKSKYADLESCWAVVRTLMKANGLSLIQLPEVSDNKVIIKSILGHSSGQFIENSLSMIPKDTTPQSVGSAITYGRRYAMSAMLGISAEDDDGNGAQGKSKEIFYDKYDKAAFDFEKRQQENFQDQYEKALLAFEKIGITEEKLLDEISFNPDKVTFQNIVDLKNYYKMVSGK